MSVTVIALQGIARDPDDVDPVTAAGPVDRLRSFTCEGVRSR